MQVMFVRHGIAEEQGPDGKDASRRLTEEGVARTRDAMRGLSRIVEPPRAIFTSPKTRARQTAELAAEQWNLPADQLRACDELAGLSAHAITQVIRECRQPVVMLVGHEPTLSQTIESLCTGERIHGFVEMKKAGCALVELDDNTRGRLLWLLTPRVLVALACQA
ncbi:MAG: phosphohistidine phosphatase SixA [Phycisphaeraceae bacterium]|nr:phosphohistidine phosphatase SixA [Phycisphaeraceae bacterium]